MDWCVYEQRGGNLIWVANIDNMDYSEVCEWWNQQFGHNYGKVIILPREHIYDHKVYR